MALKKSDLYSSIWASCDELRDGMDASQYKDYVLFMLFIKYVSDKYGDYDGFEPPIVIPKGGSFKDMAAFKGSGDMRDKINTQIIQPLIDADASLARSDFPDFNDPNKLGDGQARVERLGNLIAIFENPALDFSRNRAEASHAPVRYEFPREVVIEAVVNAVAHRDYTSHGRVQVMLFSDRLEIWNPGTLASSLTLAKLRELHGSVPANPLLAEPMYLVGYIERIGTGTGDMIRRCRESGLPKPEFPVSDGFVTALRRLPVPAKVTPPVALLIRLLRAKGEMGNAEIRRHLGLRDRTHLRERYLSPSLEGGWIEMSLPDKPNSPDENQMGG